MEQSQWSVVRHAIRQVSRSLTALPRAKYSDLLIACFYFWAVLHERPMTWAIDPAHHRACFRPRRTPSISQLNRRIASDRFQQLLQRVHERLAGDSSGKGLTVDGHALLVGACSQDRDAKAGHAPGGMARGYKLHAITDSNQNIPVFSVAALNCHELPVAMVMLARLPFSLQGTLVMADGNYDSHVLHKYIDHRGGFLITRPRGRAKHPVTLRQMGRARRHLLRLWTTCPKTVQAVYHYRKGIERCFGNLACIAGLLGNLPKWVRGLARVRRYVGAKVCLYHAHRIAKRMATSEL
jgi:hypothetical protein